MKKLFALCLMVFCVLVPAAHGQGLDDEYVQIYKLIQEADSLSSSAPTQALAKYLDAQTALDRLHKGSPDWNTRIVSYRLSYLADRISALSQKTPTSSAQTNETKAATASATTAPADWQARSAAFQERIGQLQSDNALLQAKLKEALAVRPAAVDPAELAKAQDRIKSLEKENELLKASREKESQTPVDNSGIDDPRRALVEVNRQLADQTALVAKLKFDKEALESRLKHLNEQASETKSAPTSEADTSKIKQLEKDRDDLQRRLDSANKQLTARKHKGGTGQTEELESQLASARAQLEVLQAHATPYTQEELDLMHRPETKLTETSPKAGKKSIHDLPPGAAAQVAEAQRYFAAKQFDKAELAYKDVLKQDPKNAAALGNLAAIQVEAHHFDQAESNIQQALALDPDDPYSLYVLGILRFREAKYDDALGALSRSAKLDPQNAEVQNYLGLALSEKGMRAPAEAALRKAIQLQPSYAGAHYNLAVVYATQQPPAMELARFHYQKAIAAGHQRNAELEKRFEVKQ